MTDVELGAPRVILRPYQRRARQLAREAYVAGKRAILYVAPTGAGKTVILGDTITSHLRGMAGRGRVNVYAHRRELLTQAARTFRAFGLDVGVFGEGAAHPVQVVSTQGALAKGEVTACTLAVFDEAHHYAADEYGTLVEAHREGGATICGATATPERADGRGLGHMFDHLVVVAQPPELVEAWREDATTGLVPCEVVKPSRRVPKGKIAGSPANAYKRWAKGRRAVVFAPNVKAAEDFAAEFAGLGLVSLVVHGKLPGEERDRRLEHFTRGLCPVLINVMVLTEGWDCPVADAAILARDCGSTGLFLQIAGRIMRPHPGKTSCLLIDLRGTSEAHGHPQDEREYSLDGLGISSGSGVGFTVTERLCKICKGLLDEALVCTKCGRDHTPGTPEAADIELERWEYKRREDDGDRVAQLVRWFRKFGGVAKRTGEPGRKPYFYMSRYRAVYGTVPPVAIWNAARDAAGRRGAA